MARALLEEKGYTLKPQTYMNNSGMAVLIYTSFINYLLKT